MLTIMAKAQSPSSSFNRHPHHLTKSAPHNRKESTIAGDELPGEEDGNDWLARTNSFWKLTYLLLALAVIACGQRSSSSSLTTTPTAAPRHAYGCPPVATGQMCHATPCPLPPSHRCQPRRPRPCHHSLLLDLEQIQPMPPPLD